MPDANANLKIGVNVEVWGFDAKDFETVKQLVETRQYRQLDRLATYHDDGKNLVVNAGADQIANLICGVNTSSFTHCAAGSNSTAVAASDTALNTQIGSRVSVGYRYLESTGKGHFDTLFGTSDANGTWLETGLFTASSGGTMLARKIISSFVKSSTNTAVIAWTITFTPV